MRKFPIAVMALALLSSGCATRQMANLVSKLAKDPATVHLSITSIYGTVKLTRTNPQGTNAITTSVAPDGTVTFKQGP